jgi:hypothetical protein
MTLRDSRTLRVLAAAQHQSGETVRRSTGVRFTPLPSPARTGVILDTGSPDENRRRFLLPPPEASGDFP